MTRSRIFTVFLILLIIPSLVNAQRWKRSRYEFSLGIGASNFLGELGGANQIGTHGLKDFEWSATNLAAAIGLRYKISKYFALNTHLTYGRVSGDDKLTEEPARHLRNLNFVSNIYEFNINLEGAYQEEQMGNIYHRKGTHGLHGYEVYMYGFAGVGIFYFDPKATYDGTTYHLHDLGTEGQGWGGKSQYSLLQFCIPLGVGFKYTLDRTWGVGLELGVRKTFTDYIDDVSTVYFDFSNTGAPDYIKELADPSHQEAGAQRGNSKENDAYIFAVFSVNYRLQAARRSVARF
jgi:hypothetical protein